MRVCKTYTHTHTHRVHRAMSRQPRCMRQSAPFVGPRAHCIVSCSRTCGAHRAPRALHLYHTRRALRATITQRCIKLVSPASEFGAPFCGRLVVVMPSDSVSATAMTKLLRWTRAAFTPKKSQEHRTPLRLILTVVPISFRHAAASLYRVTCLLCRSQP